MLITSALITGIAMGAMYGLLALGFHITYAVSNTVNFSQGASMMLGAVLGYTFAVTLNWPMPLAVIAALLCCAIFGLFVERFLVRPFVARGSNGWLMATIAGGIVLENIVLFTFGKEPRGFPSDLAKETISVFGSGAYPLQLVIPITGLSIAASLWLVMHRTKVGMAIQAVVQRPEAARLMGINTQWFIAGSFALSTVLAGIAGMLIAPLFHVSAGMGTIFGVKAFAAAIIGGLNSAWGVMVAGLLYGISEALVTAYLGSSYTQIASFSFVILVLVFAPNGLFGRADVQKV